MSRSTAVTEAQPQGTPSLPWLIVSALLSSSFASLVLSRLLLDLRASDKEAFDDKVTTDGLFTRESLPRVKRPLRSRSLALNRQIHRRQTLNFIGTLAQFEAQFAFVCVVDGSVPLCGILCPCHCARLPCLLFTLDGEERAERREVGSSGASVGIVGAATVRCRCRSSERD